MARKPSPSLPDVFAKPGTAPPRGPALEDLPQPPEPEPMAAAPEPVVEPEPPPAAPPPPTPAPVVNVEPEPQQTDEFYEAPPPRQPVGRRGMVLAMVAIAIALTTPFWEDSLLSLVGIRTPIGRAVEQSTLAVMRQDARTADIAQRLSAAMVEITHQQAQFAATMRRADATGAMIRTMALVRLSNTLRQPLPFADELVMVRATGTDLGELKPLLDQIQPYADTGIPGPAQLRHDFEALLDKVPHSDAGGSWMSDIASWARLRSPPPPPAQPDPSPELLRAASERLANMDVAGAVDRVQHASDAYRSVFANWLEDAQARVAADRIADTVSEMVAQSLRPVAN